MATTQSSKFRKKKIPFSQPQTISSLSEINADDDFQDPSPSLLGFKTTLTQQPLKPSNNSSQRPLKKLKKQPVFISSGKENNFASQNFPGPPPVKEECRNKEEVELDLFGGGLDALELSLDSEDNGRFNTSTNDESDKMGLEQFGSGQLGCTVSSFVECEGNENEEEFEGCTQLDVLIKLCDSGERVQDNEIIQDYKGDFDFGEEYNNLEEQEAGEPGNGKEVGLICCPLCGKDISELQEDLRQVHMNECLDKEEAANDVSLPADGSTGPCPGQVFDCSPGQSPQKVVDVSPVSQWLCNLGLAKYVKFFVQEEIDWDTLTWLTEEDLFNIGVSALGPRKKIIHALGEIKAGCKETKDQPDDSRVIENITNKLGTNKLITDYFPGSVAERKCSTIASKGQKNAQKNHCVSANRSVQKKKQARSLKQKDAPVWCSIPGTPFRVDAFKCLTRDCCHWFLTHFHMDHYQGLTRSFSHGKIYCSLITAKLVNMKLGISWDKLQVLPLNQKTTIAGVDVTCFDANHCPGAVILLFEPPNGKAVLHTGDFRFCDEIAKISTLQTRAIHTLILDTTYCDPQYDFPKQEAVIQFVIEAIQAEEFNPRTLFLIGSYTIGKERLFMEVARVLHKKIYVGAAKLRLLECLEYPKEDMQWLTLNEHESHIHVVPMWTLASFKRLKHVANQYAGRFNLIVAFSPTGWSFGKGKKKSSGKRSQQGTIIRYEVPYSEHSSYTELRDFVKFISPATIIPSVNNYGPESASTMLSHLLA